MPSKLTRVFERYLGKAHAKLNQKSAPLSTSIAGITQRGPDVVLPAPTVTQEQTLSTSKAVVTLEELNSDAAKKVYRKRLASNEIRLIKIHAGSDPSAVQCSTFSVQKGDLPDYEALSYVCRYAALTL